MPIQPLLYIQFLQYCIQNLRPVFPTPPDRSIFVHSDLACSTLVFRRREALTAPLIRSYDGLYPVHNKAPKFGTILLNGREGFVLLDRHKPAYHETPPKKYRLEVAGLTSHMLTSKTELCLAIVCNSTSSLDVAASSALAPSRAPLLRHPHSACWCQLRESRQIKARAGRALSLCKARAT